MPALTKDNPWIEIRNSTIHGSGVFARRDIPRGTRIIEYVGERISKAEALRRAERQVRRSKKHGDGAVYIFEATSKTDIDGNVPWNPARLINHSCKPNCRAENDKGRIWIYATRRIPAGTELNYDYGYDLEHYEDHPCLCGQDNCVGHIVGRQYRPTLQRKLARAGKK